MRDMFGLEIANTHTKEELLEINKTLINKIESLRKDAARWKYIESHWTFADIKNNKDGSFKNMTITFDADKPTNEIGAEKLRKGFDSVIAAMPEGE